MKTPHISKPFLGFFRYIVRGYFKRHFRAVRVLGSERFIAAGQQNKPLIVYANHCSWWDPMVQVLLAAELMPKRNHYAPMDAAALERYRIFKHIGVFGVETKTTRGAAQFMRIGLSVLEENGVLWVTPQGRFADAREHPVEFKPGLAALASRVKGSCTVLPLAIEYTFWNERLPEVLLLVGEAIDVEETTSEAIEERLKFALTQAMNDLKLLAMKRDASEFTLLQSGTVGTGGFYQLGQSILARMQGRRYQAEHTETQEAKRG
jgi:1-acyl-sn-glycerol-3-phosphate acyltransferase